MDQPVGDILGGSGWRYNTPVLIAYRYPSVELGPKSTTGEQVVVFHRCGVHSGDACSCCKVMQAQGNASSPFAISG